MPSSLTPRALASRALTLALVLLTSLSAASLAKAPHPVSPGAARPGAVAEARCPTFSWAGVPEASGYELAVFRVRMTDEVPVLVTRASLAGDARGWTPPVGRCLERGERYAWSVAATTGEGERLDWSAPFLFEVEAAPSASELERAMATIESYLEDGRAATPGRGPRAASGDAGESAEPSEQRAAAPRGARPLSDAGRGMLDRDALASPTTGERIRSANTAPVFGDASLKVSGQIHLAANSAFFKYDFPFLWDDLDGNTALGRNALRSTNQFTGHNTAVGRDALRYSARSEPYVLSSYEGTYNTAIGDKALRQNSLGWSNTAAGAYALRSNTEGDLNTAVGSGALELNLVGRRNTALGAYALEVNNSTGNTATGAFALQTNTTGLRNTANGYGAMRINSTGERNVALGSNALNGGSTGSFNVAIGAYALFGNSAGDNNTALGFNGGSLTTGSYNVLIHNNGGTTPAETHVMRIGQSTIPAFALTQVVIQGIRGQMTGVADAIPVVIDSAGELGTVSSSRSVKQDIRDLGDDEAVAERLLALRPVSFRYRQHAAADPDTPLEFGLVAEEVAEVFPDLVVYDAEGKPQTVKYHLLSSLLLGELQRVNARLAALEERVELPRAPGD